MEGYMKRIPNLGLILCACFVSAVWAQQQQVMPRMGGRAILRHRIFNVAPKSAATASNRSISTQAATAKNVEVYDLGTYPGGTWAEMGGINDLGVAVAQGTVGPDEVNHLFTIRLLGPRAPEWFDLGALGAYEGWFTWPVIADTNLIVSYAATAELDPVTGMPYVHAFAWTGKSKRVDLGTLADIGYDPYNNSVAQAVNKLGTIIGGYVWDSTSGATLPVVWTPAIVWKPDGPAITWKIHTLDTKEFPYGFVTGANDFGQLAGAAFNDAGHYVAALWNPLKGGKRWEMIQLPGSEAWPDVTIAGDINEKGEIVGDVLSVDWANGYSSLWQPADPLRRTYKLTLLPNLWGLPQGDTAEGINDLGDIVGGSWDADYNFVAVRWSTKDPTFVEPLGFPGDSSLAFKVNDQRIATGLYRGGTCAHRCVAAVQIR
jgi:uncharacterized membrane protein